MKALHSSKNNMKNERPSELAPEIDEKNERRIYFPMKSMLRCSYGGAEQEEE